MAAKNDSSIDSDTLFDHLGAAARGSGIFGLPCTPEEAEIVLLPVPWEATVSYGGGTAEGPLAILKASTQVDLFDREIGSLYRARIAMLPESKDVRRWNSEAKEHALKVMEKGFADASNRKDADAVNALSDKVNAFVEEQTMAILKQGKIPGLIGGEHSTPFGAIKAVAAAHPGMGVLHFDTHCDLRKAFEDLGHSHASIMRHVAEDIPNVAKLVQVGVRDFCREEMEVIEKSKGRIKTFFDEDNWARLFSGTRWAEICEEIVAELPKEVYISFDIDALDPGLCPHTGTPVAGGLNWNQALFLIKAVAKSGKKIVGFDLVEVAPGDDEWDANVGVRLLFKLCAWTLRSQKLV
ncbi:MAG: agmatinase family protein [Candidatus Peribacteraceae bacterium]